MSEASQIQFDDPPRGGPAEGPPATERIAATLKSAGIDAPNALYDEALAYARDGHLGQAQARLQMLICLDPDDSDALLLLAKLHLAQGRPAEALARLDAAVAAGGSPAGFREHLEAAIRAERAREEEHRARVAAREQGEIRSLRNETRNLRSEQVRLETEVSETRLRERNWKYAALSTSVVATLVILLLVFVGAPGRSGAEDADAAATAAATADAPTATAAPRADATAAEVAVPGRASRASAVPSAASPTAASPTAAAPGRAGGVAAVGAATAAGSATAAAAATTDPAAAPTPAPAAKTMAGGTVHEVAAGDTLARLASRYYGDASRWEEIRTANASTLKGGIALSIGMKLTIP